MAAQVQQMYKDCKGGKLDKENMSSHEKKVYAKGVKEYMPYKDKSNQINNLKFIYLLTHDTQTPKIVESRARHEDMMQFQQHLATGHAECFQGGKEDPSKLIKIYSKLKNILISESFTKSEKEQAVLLYYAQMGSKCSAHLQQEMDTCDGQFGTHCHEKLQQLKYILGSEYSQAEPADTRRRDHYLHVSEQLEKGLKEDFDMTGLENVWGVKWPSKVTDSPETMSEMCKQGQYFDSWTPRIFGMCDQILSDKMSADLCPYVLGQERGQLPTRPKHSRNNSLSGGASWTKSKKAAGGGGKESKGGDAPELVVFVIGGICHEEIQSMYELISKHNKDVYIGSTHMTNAQMFMERGLAGMAQLD